MGPTGSILVFVIVVQSLSRVQFFVNPWTVAHQAPLSFTISQSLLRFMSIESVMLLNHFVLCYTLLFLQRRKQVNQHFLKSII